MKSMVNASDLEAIGFKRYQAQTIIRQAKLLMVKKGFGLYNGKRLGVVPLDPVEKIIGVKLEFNEDDDNNGND
ncbi:DUF3173 domain-containing protein [Levilactobacillus suantsaiihabitans]|uniref:DUF3173 domain-containing protein n=2 Tax=Lactobacillaceae TaxID=33958 RepID=A0A4Z0J9S3_9LACO|nr:DUF3173 family protein [Levilactobacillus suantsaiihabitans]TGD19493.1 DUF3173 domain-containing protein [Levilactobacillus suantsaiihabitans]